jgi:hypothetical protein
MGAPAVSISLQLDNTAELKAPPDVFPHVEPADQARQRHGLLAYRSPVQCRVTLRTSPSTTHVSLAGDDAPSKMEQQEPTVGEFARLANQWRSETAHYAVASRRFAHDSFFDILVMGRAALPLIMEDMRRTRDHWFPALRAMLKPFDAAKDATTHDEAVDAWLRWYDSRAKSDVP